MTAAGVSPIQISRGIEKTTRALISELKLMSKEVFGLISCLSFIIFSNDNKVFQVEDHELVNVASVSAGNDYAIGSMISDALLQVGRQGFVTIQKGNYAENSLDIVEGMQFDRGYLSPYFVTDRQKRTVEFHDCKVWKLVLV